MDTLFTILLLGVFGLPLLGFVISIGIYVFAGLYQFAKQEFGS